MPWLGLLVLHFMHIELTAGVRVDSVCLFYLAIRMMGTWPFPCCMPAHIVLKCSCTNGSLVEPAQLHLCV